MNRILFSFLVALVTMFACLGNAQAQNWTWKGEEAKASQFYLRNIGSQKFIDTDNKGVSDLSEADLISLEANSSKFNLKYVSNGKNYYLTQSLKGQNVDALFTEHKVNWEQSKGVGMSFSKQNVEGESVYEIQTAVSFRVVFVPVNGNINLSADDNGLHSYGNSVSEINANAFKWQLISQHQKECYEKFIQDYTSLNSKYSGQALISLELKKKVYECNSKTYDMDSYNEVSEVLKECDEYVASVPNATLEESKDVTGMIVNPDFETNVDGWTGNVKANSNNGPDDKKGIAEPDAWDKNAGKTASMSQTITGLPNGCYTIEMSYKGTGKASVNLYGNDDVKNAACTADWNIITVDVIVSDGQLTIIGEVVTSEKENWGNVDAYRLYYLGKTDAATIKIKTNCYGTFVAPFDVTLPEGVVAYSVASSTADKATLSPFTLNAGNVLPAGNPVIVKHESGKEVNETYYGPFATTESVTKNGLLGFYETGTTIADGCYVLQSQSDGVQKFYIVASGNDGALTKSTKNRCCLPAGSISGAKVLNLVFEDETAVGNIESEATIVGYYSINGSKLAAPQAGVNIVKMSNGSVKKVFVK